MKAATWTAALVVATLGLAASARAIDAGAPGSKEGAQWAPFATIRFAGQAQDPAKLVAPPAPAVAKLAASGQKPKNLSSTTATLGAPGKLPPATRLPLLSQGNVNRLAGGPASHLSTRPPFEDVNRPMMDKRAVGPLP